MSAQPIKPTAMLVEDDPFSRKLLSAYLGDRFEITSATNVTDAKQILQEVTVHIVFLDLSLEGDSDGLTLCRWIRSTPELAHIPVVATTAHAFTHDINTCLEAGCNRVVTKPIQKALFMRTIEELYP